MKVRAGSGWQTVLADLSLILFMLTASAVSQGRPASAEAGKREEPRPEQPLRGDPVAVWRPDTGGPSLAQWLAGQDADPRQRLTLVVAYAPGGEAAALARAQALLAGLAVPARVIVEPGEATETYAALTFDLAGQVAQPLQKGWQRP